MNPTPPDPADLAALPDLEARVHRALAAWHGDPAAASPLAGLALVQQAQAAGSLPAQRAANQALLAALEALAALAPQDAALLRRRFVDGKPAFVVARELHLAEPTVYKQQRRALGRLAGVLAQQERQARAQRGAAAAARLPWIEYQRLFGVEALHDQLAALLAADGPPWIVLLTGLGGVGKTAAARAALEQVVRGAGPWFEVGWVSAQQHAFHPGGGLRRLDAPALSAGDLLLALAAQLLPAGDQGLALAGPGLVDALRQRLRATPHLVVIDNLETLPDVAELLPALRRLAGPSRFLLTSRRALVDEPDVYHLAVPELGEGDALALLRFEAQVRNLPAVAAAADEALRPIYATVGGNPLALKLVAGQLYLWPLPQVLESLRQARGERVAGLYRYIYWQAWRQLDAEGQEVLLTMPLFAQGGAELAAIERVCEVRGERLADALERLVTLSLVNVGGDLWGRRYSIHRLTETFLLREVVRWQEGAVEEGWA